MTEQVFSRMLKAGIQYLPVDSIQTSVQEYLASQAANSLSPLKKEEKRACLYSVGRDRFTGYGNAPNIDALTDGGPI